MDALAEMSEAQLPLCLVPSHPVRAHPARRGRKGMRAGLPKTLIIKHVIEIETYSLDINKLNRLYSSNK